MRIAKPWLLLIVVPAMLLAASSESNESGSIDATEADEQATQPSLSPSELAERALEIEAREAALRELEAAIMAQLDDLQRSQQAASAVLEPEMREREAEVAKLVAFYQSMKPKNAAELLEKLPLDLATSVLSRMKQREAGKILNVMDDTRAVLISRQMAESKP